MDRTRLFLLALLLGCSWFAPLVAQAPRTSSRFTGPLRELPDREADAIHLRLEVSFDWEKKEVTAKAQHVFRALRPLHSITLHAVDIHVLRAASQDGATLETESRPDTLRVDLGREVPRGEEVRFTLDYRCRPRRGVYFHAPSEAYPRTPKQIWTQGETEEARHWIPCFDHPSDKLTTEVLVTAPAGLVGLSNGRLVGEKAAPDGGKVFHWSLEKPHSTYLIAVVVGDFAEHRDEWKGIPLVAYVPRERAADAARSFSLTKDMMEFFSEKTGVPYPWARYGQVCVNEFLFGGMENTTLTILTDRTLHDETAAQDVESIGLVAHELAHQWFGDLATCRDWAEIWLNESFASFFDVLYTEKLRGPEEAFMDRMGQEEAYLGEDRGEYRRPLVTYRYRSPDDVFDAHAYPKGARILSMLRYVLGDEHFFDGIRRYLEARAHQPAETDDLRRAMEDASGRSLRWFFDQWVRGGGHPQYAVKSEWDERSGVVRVEVRQTQKVDELTALFRMPVEIEVVTTSKRDLHRVEVARAEETFTFPAKERPLMVRFDKKGAILKELEFPRSREELLHQLEHDEEVAGRIEAARGLSRRQDEEVRSTLLSRLAREPFWGVRVELVKALRPFGGKEAREGLIAAFGTEKKSRVRREVVQALADYPGEETAAFLRKAIATDSSYFVVGDTLRALSRLDRKGVLADAYRALERNSHQEEIRIAAIEAIGRNAALEGKEREEAVERLLALHERGRPIPVRLAAGRALTRVGKGSDRVYQALSAAVDDPAVEIRFNAFRHLGDLGDRRGIEVLRERRGKESHRPFRNPLDAIDEAVKRLESEGDRDQVLEELRRLREGREDLERRLKVLEKRGSEGKGARGEF